MPSQPAGDDAVELSIVIPAYNEAPAIADTLRTIAAYLDRQSYVSEVIVVDDGSVDGTARILVESSTKYPAVRVLHHHPNRGKGASIRRGVLEARGKYIFFMDADLSVPIDELTGALAGISHGEEPILIGSRKIQGARIERRQPLLREYLGHGFTYFTRFLLSPSIVDFTCGFKGFRRANARMLFSVQQCNDWAFDAEILYLARLLGMRVRQYPVRWKHQKNSRVRFPRDIYRTLASLLRIRWRTGRALREQSRRSVPVTTRHGCEE